MTKLPKDREHLVLDNLSLVHYLLCKKLHIYPNTSEYEDCYQEGVIGLILSAIRYDETTGFKFSTFASANIICCISKYRRENYSLLHIPRQVQDQIFSILKYTTQGFSVQEIEQLTGCSSEQIKTLLNIHEYNLDSPISSSEDKNLTIGDTVQDSNNNLDSFININSLMELINRVTETISVNSHREVWKYYLHCKMYGIKFVQRNAAKIFNLSQPQISRIIHNNKSKLYNLIEDEY